MWMQIKDNHIVGIIKRPKDIDMGDGLVHPAAIFAMWSDEERAAIGIWPIIRAKQPNPKIQRVVDAPSYSFDGTQGIETIIVQDRPLADVQIEALVAIDDAAGRARTRYITDVPGQAATYLLKAQQADAYKATGYPVDLTEFPMIAAEMASSGMSGMDSANYIIATRDQWVVLAAEIEKQRLTGKIAISNATIDTIVAIEATTLGILNAI